LLSLPFAPPFLSFFFSFLSSFPFCLIADPKEVRRQRAAAGKKMKKGGR